jgi:hypothetical protein
MSGPQKILMKCYMNIELCTAYLWGLDEIMKVTDEIQGRFCSELLGLSRYSANGMEEGNRKRQQKGKSMCKAANY